MADLQALRREQEKAAAALQEVAGRVAAIEAAEQKQREEAERKARELAALKRSLEKCVGWIGFTEKKLAELREDARRVARSACSDASGGLILRLQEQAAGILGWERVLQVLTGQEAAFESEIKKMTEAQ